MSIKTTVTVFDHLDRRVGFFLDPGHADGYISSRVNPRLFTARPGKQPPGPSAPGIYLKKGDKRMKNADENGFLPNPPWPKTRKSKAKRTTNEERPDAEGADDE